jgi:hypothetical protein
MIVVHNTRHTRVRDHDQEKPGQTRRSISYIGQHISGIPSGAESHRRHLSILPGWANPHLSILPRPGQSTEASSPAAAGPRQNSNHSPPRRDHDLVSRTLSQQGRPCGYLCVRSPGIRGWHNHAKRRHDVRRLSARPVSAPRGPRAHRLPRLSARPVHATVRQPLRQPRRAAPRTTERPAARTPLNLRTPCWRHRAPAVKGRL